MLPFGSAASPSPPGIVAAASLPPTPPPSLVPTSSPTSPSPSPLSCLSPPVLARVCLYGTLVSLHLFLLHHHRLHLPGLCILSRFFFFFLVKENTCSWS